jgi:hypothetical protein
MSQDERATAQRIEAQLEAEGSLGVTRRANNAVLSPRVKSITKEELDTRELIIEGPPLWEQLSMENDKQYSAFLLYRGMPPESRSVQKTGELLAKSKTYNADYCKILSSQYFWWRRAKAYDVYAERQRRLEEEDKEALAGRAAPNWVLRSRKARDFYYDIAQDMKLVAKEVLNRAAAPASEPKSVADEEADGQLLEDAKEISLGMKVSDFVNWVRCAYTLEKSALEWQTTGVTGVARKGKGKAAPTQDELNAENILTASAHDIKKALGLERFVGKSGSTTRQ